VRERKFRAWNKETQKMIQKPLLPLGTDLWPINNIFTVYKKFIWMQYIGLKDKNGCEIYEGDKVKIYCSCGYTDVGVVEWNHNGFRLHFQYAHNWDNEQDMFNNYASDREVIGNIYKNPELLEVEKCGGDKD